MQMEDPTSAAMIGRWIADYYSHLVWKQFEKDGCILCPGVREYIFLQESASHHIFAHEVSADKDLTSTHEINPRLLIDFMYKISCGEKLFEDVGKSRDTLLEEAIDILDHILNVDKLCNRLDRDSIVHLKLLLKQQAVLVCCRKNEFDLADEVFGRQWRHWKNQNEMEIREKILHVVQQRSSNHRYFDLMPYSLLISGTRTLLREIFDSLKTPFLVTAAQNVSSKYSSIMQKYSFLECQNVSNDNRQASNTGYEDAETNNPMPSIDINNQMDNRSIEAETAANSEHNSKVTVSADNVTLKSGSLQIKAIEPVAEDVGKTARKSEDECSSSSQTKSKRNDNEEDSPNETSNVKRKCKEIEPACLDWEAELSSSSGLQSVESGLRKFWRPVEEERLYLGVQKYGVGRWRKVANFLGSSRSNVDVKDKWRTMTKQGKLKTYEKQFGPIVI